MKLLKLVYSIAFGFALTPFAGAMIASVNGTAGHNTDPTKDFQGNAPSEDITEIWNRTVTFNNGYCHDIVHEHIHIGENSVVNVLQHIVGCITLGLHTICCVDKTIAQRGYFNYIALNVELRNDCVHWSNILVS